MCLFISDWFESACRNLGAPRKMCVLAWISCCLVLWFKYKIGKILYKKFLCNIVVCNELVPDLELVDVCMLV
jgi:hypothetical protein